MTTHEVTLDLDKTLQLPPPTITARQGDTQCGITAMVTDHGAPATLTGYTAKFQAAKPDGTYAEQAAQISGSTVTVELDPQFLAAAGLIRTAYFRFFEGTAEKESTQNMCIRVIHDAEGEAPDLSTSYIPTVDQLVEDATEALNSANTALGNAEEALEDAEAATDSATDAAASANAAANAAQSAIDAMTGNVLRGTVGPSKVVSVDDAYPQVPLGVKVKGQTRQNLWVNPSGSSAGGITVKSNTNGTLTVSGTNSTDNPTYVNATSYLLKPNTEYTFSVDKKLGDTNSDNFATCFDIVERSSSGAWITEYTVGHGSILSRTFTTGNTLAYVHMRVLVQPGVTVSGTYRIMLNEGSEAQPWCPPGLNSVDELSIVTAGKNLAVVEELGTGSDSYNKLISTSLPEGRYTISGILRSGTAVNIKDGSAEGSVIKHITSLPATIDVKNGQSLFANSHNFGEYDNTADIISNLQLELGPTATAYEPPIVTATPIDLDGHTLNSLPDGTCDVLHVDGTGAVSIENECILEVFDGSENWELVQNEQYGEYYAIKDIGNYTSQRSALCDSLPVSNPYSTSGSCAYVFGVQSGRAEIRMRVAGVEGVEALKSWLAANPVKILYERQEKKEVDLPGIAMPTLPGPIANVWAVATYGHGNTFTLQPEIELEYARDVTLVIGSLEAKVAALELLHESE